MDSVHLKPINFAFNDLLLVVPGLLETSGSHRFDMESLVAVSDAPKVPNPNGFAMSCRVAGSHHGILGTETNASSSLSVNYQENTPKATFPHIQKVSALLVSSAEVGYYLLQ